MCPSGCPYLAHVYTFQQSSEHSQSEELIEVADSRGAVGWLAHLFLQSLSGGSGAHRMSASLTLLSVSGTAQLLSQTLVLSAFGVLPGALC